MSKPESPISNQDALIDASTQAVMFYHENKNRVLAVGGGLLAVIILVTGLFFLRSQREQQAQVLLGIAEQYLAGGNLEASLDGVESEFTIGFNQIADQYSWTKAGNLAHYYAAIANFEIGNLENALSHISSYKAPKGIIGVGAIALHAQILMDLGSHTEAAETFIEAAEWNLNEVTTPANLLDAAKAYSLAGSSDKALQLSERILKDYPQSLQSGQALQLKGELIVSAEPGA